MGLKRPRPGGSDTEPQIEILDVRHFTGRQLRGLLEEEAAIWEKRLRWEYMSSTELLIEYLDSQILPGFVARLRGRILGYCFCVYEGNKAVIGDVFVSRYAPERLAVTHTLTRHLLEVLEASPDIDRIESQLLLFDPGSLSPAFAAEGFRVFPRLFLEFDLPAKKTPERFPSDAVMLRPWTASLYQGTAELIHAAYAGHIDSEINDQYRTLHGSLRFLHNIVRFPGCGVFDPACSWALRERETNALAGVILCSRVAPDVAHITQLCVGTAWRGQGLGAWLLHACMDALPAHGYKALTLTVTEGNESAVRLYGAAGFRTRLRFEAYVHDKALPGQGFLPAMRAGNEAPSEGGGGVFAFARRRPIPGRN